MAHAIRIRAAADQNSESESEKWGADELHRRVEDDVFGSGFSRVLAGEDTDEGESDQDQEQSLQLIEDDLGDRPDHFLGLYRTADREDLDEFIEAFEDEVAYDASWFQLEPHDCTHDREIGGPCEVYDGEELENKIVERGNVPESISYV